MKSGTRAIEKQRAHAQNLLNFVTQEPPVRELDRIRTPISRDFWRIVEVEPVFPIPSSFPMAIEYTESVTTKSVYGEYTPGGGATFYNYGNEQ